MKQLLTSLAAFVRAADGTRSPASISLAINGLQSIDSRCPEAQALIEVLAEIVERSEGDGVAFGSLNEVFAAIAVFSSMSAEQKPVYRLLCSVVRLTELSSVVRNPRRQDIRGERLAFAIYGLQGCNSRSQPARDILRLLTPSIREMPPLKGKELGMVFQGFKACRGKPSEEHAAALDALSTKIVGWSSSKRSGTGDIQITLRSALWGMSKLDRRHPAVQSVLAEIAAEVLVMVDSDGKMEELDPKTVNTLREVYRGVDLDAEPTVSRLLSLLKIEYHSKSQSYSDSDASLHSDEDATDSPRM